MLAFMQLATRGGIDCMSHESALMAASAMLLLHHAAALNLARGP